MIKNRGQFATVRSTHASRFGGFGLTQGGRTRAIYLHGSALVSSRRREIPNDYSDRRRLHFARHNAYGRSQNQLRPRMISMQRKHEHSRRYSVDITLREKWNHRDRCFEILIIAAIAAVNSQRKSAKGITTWQSLFAQNAPLWRKRCFALPQIGGTNPSLSLPVSRQFKKRSVNSTTGRFLPRGAMFEGAHTSARVVLVPSPWKHKVAVELS